MQSNELAWKPNSDVVAPNYGEIRVFGQAARCP